MDQSDKVGMDGGEKRVAKTGRGVRQGCCLSLTLFDFYRKYLTKEALEGVRNFKLGQVTPTAKYADDLVLVAEEEIVLQDMINRLTETGRYGMEMNVEGK